MLEEDGGCHLHPPQDVSLDADSSCYRQDVEMKWLPFPSQQPPSLAGLSGGQMQRQNLGKRTMPSNGHYDNGLVHHLSILGWAALCRDETGLTV
jgi:hypothetical protein